MIEVCVHPVPCSDRVCRNHVPWAILSACSLAAAILMLVTRMYLASENQRRDQEEHDPTYDDVYIVRTSGDGTIEKVKVDKVS